MEGNKLREEVLKEVLTNKLKDKILIPRAKTEKKDREGIIVLFENGIKKAIQRTQELMKIKNQEYINWNYDKGIKDAEADFRKMIEDLIKDNESYEKGADKKLKPQYNHTIVYLQKLLDKLGTSHNLQKSYGDRRVGNPEDEGLNSPNSFIKKDIPSGVNNKGCGKKVPHGFDRDLGYELHDTCGFMDNLCPSCKNLCQTIINENTGEICGHEKGDHITFDEHPCYKDVNCPCRKFQEVVK